MGVGTCIVDKSKQRCYAAKSMRRETGSKRGDAEGGRRGATSSI